MSTEGQSPDNAVIDIDAIERCQTFDELKQSDAFGKFMRILRKRTDVFPESLDTADEEVLIQYFAINPSIWKEAEELWMTKIKKLGENMKDFHVESISNHIRNLIAREIQQGGLHLNDAEDRGAIFDFESHVDRPDRAYQPDFTDPDNAAANINAEMAFDLSPAIQEARIPRKSDPGYTKVPDALYDATQEWLKKAHSGWQLNNPREEIIYARGALKMIQEAVGAFVGTRKKKGVKGLFGKREKGNAVTCTPTYGGLLHHPVKVLGEDTKTIPLITKNGQLVIDTNTLRENLEEGDVFILCSPQNPGGHVYSKDELLEIKEICKQKKVKIIVDELHDGLVFKDNFVSLGSLYEGEENPTATLLSTGKSFNLSDQPCHMMVIPNEDMRSEFQNHRTDGLTPTAMPNRAAIAAFTQSDEWRMELLDYLEKNAEYAYQRIQAMPGLSMPKPEGTYLAWIDAREAGLDEAIAKEFADDPPHRRAYRGPSDYFAKIANVGVSSGRNFDTSGASDLFFRLNFAVPRSELIEILDRIEQALPKKI